MREPRQPECPYCGSIALFVDSAIIYHGKSYGVALVCSRYPECDSYVGCHKNTGMPKGRMANAELRAAKIAAHAAFDPKWKSGRMSRSEAYSWLALLLGITREKCHIGMFDLDLCNRVLEVCGA